MEFAVNVRQEQLITLVIKLVFQYVLEINNFTMRIASVFQDLLE